jgi:hypothetical protein
MTDEARAQEMARDLLAATGNAFSAMAEAERRCGYQRGSDGGVSRQAHPHYDRVMEILRSKGAWNER